MNKFNCEFIVKSEIIVQDRGGMFYVVTETCTMYNKEFFYEKKVALKILLTHFPRGKILKNKI